MVLIAINEKIRMYDYSLWKKFHLHRIYNKKPMSNSNLVEKFLMVVNYYY